MEHSPQVNAVSEPRKWKRGEVGPDGRVFWEKNKAFPSGEYWVAAEDYPRMVEAKRASKKAFYERHREKILAYSKIRHAKVCTTAAHKAERKKYRDANAARMRKREAAWRKKAVLECPELRIVCAIRGRIKAAVSREANSGHRISSRAQDKEAARFLVWLAARQGVDPRDGRTWHVDHLIPISKCEDLSKANQPENVRWLRAEVNTGRRDADATPEEIAEHQMLVQEWRNSLKVPNPA